MNCPFTKCTRHIDCGILEIIKKIPISLESCSYSKSIEQQNKDIKKKEKEIEQIKVAKKNKKNKA
ncbi:MAG: hypothetical protein PHF86_07235 [Candidatus Nanoarchaeia archaeon]|jgi:hypothetical protein|nr:hypothetical protein [Candidatus Nanoarchaeia archaeon]